MNYQWMGAALVIAGCGGFGFAMASEYLRESRTLRQLVSAMDYMACELQFSAAPLPQICGQIGRESAGPVGRVFRSLQLALEEDSGGSVALCMDKVLTEAGNLTGRPEKYCRLLGNSLGRFDLQGQLNALESLRTQCRRELEEMDKARENRVREYQTLGLCAGAALAIILI